MTASAGWGGFASFVPDPDRPDPDRYDSRRAVDAMASYCRTMAARTRSAAEQALATERWLHPDTRELSAGDLVGAGKALLVRDLDEPLRCLRNVSLRRVVSARHWATYETARFEVEAGLGIGASEASRLVKQLRERTTTTGLDLYLAHDEERSVVGAVARFRLPVPDRPWARLQEVDVFPGRRGLGYGDGLLAATIALLHDEGCQSVVVGADEDDWPLNWYRRRGFRDVARVPLTR